jgi:hypothetical protein
MMLPVYALLAVLALEGCTNVSSMQKKYEAGDVKQLDKLMEIVARPDYPYATRRRAARALGEIGDPRSVPVLIGALNDYDQRTTLKKEALEGLGRIGDTTAVGPIGRLLDYSLREDNAELRMAAIPVLGNLGGRRAAQILVNALRWYDVLTLREEQRTRRGIYSGEELPDPYLYGAGRTDSLGRQVGDPSVGLFPQQRGGGGFFGLDSRFPVQEAYNPTPEERQLTHAALVRTGKVALPVIEEYLTNKESTPTLKQELLAIIAEIQHPGESPADSSQVVPPPSNQEDG